jgi:PhnB protein
MTQINGYLNFNGNCREAMNFYRDCIGGELQLKTIAGSPIEAQCPTTMKDSILHSVLVKEDLVLMASDCIGPDGYTEGNNFSLCLNCSSEEEINKFYSSLSDGGEIIDPLKKQFWGSLFGVFTDKYGIRWMLNYDMNVDAAKEHISEAVAY